MRLDQFRSHKHHYLSSHLHLKHPSTISAAILKECEGGCYSREQCQHLCQHMSKLILWNVTLLPWVCDVIKTEILITQLAVKTCQL